jgi:hypothetical protein
MRGRIGEERIAEACEIDIGHRDGDRVGLGRLPRQVLEGEHRFLVELGAQRLGGGVQHGLVGGAQMEFAGPLIGGLP